MKKKPRLTKQRFLNFLRMKGFYVLAEAPVTGCPLYKNVDRGIWVCTRQGFTYVYDRSDLSRSWRYRDYEGARDRVRELIPDWIE